MEYFIEILKDFINTIPVLVTLLLKLWYDNREKKKRDTLLYDKVQEIDNKQEIKISEINDKVNKMTNSVNFLVETHKYRPEISKIIRKLEEIIDNQTDNYNKEINRIFHNTLDKISEVFYFWAETNFSEIEKKKVINILERKASAIRENINFEVLGITDSRTEFLQLLKEKIKPEIITFAVELETIAKEKTNGERVSGLEIIAKNMLTSIIVETINLANAFKIKK